MKRLFAYLYTQRRALGVWAMAAAVFGAVSALYGLPAEPFVYGTVLSGVLGVAVLGAGWPDWSRRCRTADRIAAELPRSGVRFAPPEGGDAGQEAAYQKALDRMISALADREAADRAGQDDRLDYFAMWAHQVKTPLAAMRLLLQAQQQPPCREELEAELFQTERYVGMAMDYLRLGSQTNDLVLTATPLDPVIRQCLRRFARMFILKKLTLCYEGSDLAPVTDAKWVGFILEQLLSNAVKYTPAGGRVQISAAGGTLQVTDTGIGIRPEDLPRIFEKGYTGCNGRARPAAASGLGLYLCARAARLLGGSLTAQSQPGQGTQMTLTFPVRDPLYE